MTMPSYSTVVIHLFDMLKEVLNNYVYNGYTTLADHLRYPLGLAVTLYIIILGISISQGWVRLSFDNFVKSAFKIGLIYWLAMSWATFSLYAVQGIESSAGQIGDWLVSASPVPIPHFAGEGINGAMQSVLIEVTKVGAWTWGMGSFHNWGPYLTALIVWLTGYIALFLAIAEILIAKLMLAILFCVAPLFICFTLFKPTHGFFDKWLGAIAGFAFFLILIPAAISLVLNFLQWAIAGYYADHATGMSLVGFVPVLIVAIIGVALILKVTSYAQSFGGSVSTSSGSSLLAGVIGGAVGGGMSSMKSSLSTTSTVAGGLSKVANAASGNIAGSAFSAIKNKLRSGE